MSLLLDIYPLIFLHCDVSLWKTFLKLCKNITSKILQSEFLWKEMCLKYFEEPDDFTFAYFVKSWKYGIWQNFIGLNETLNFPNWKYVRIILRQDDHISISSTRRISKVATKFELTENEMRPRYSYHQQFFYICKIAEEIFRPSKIADFTTNGILLIGCNPTRQLYHKKVFKAKNAKNVNSVNYPKLSYENDAKFVIYLQNKTTIESVSLLNYGNERCTLVPTNQDPINIF